MKSSICSYSITYPNLVNYLIENNRLELWKQQLMFCFLSQLKGGKVESLTTKQECREVL